MFRFIALFCTLLLTITNVAASSNYIMKCESALCRVIEESTKEISKLRKDIDDGALVQGLGAKADEIINESFTKFSQLAPLDNKSDETIYDKKVEDLERLLDAPLHVIYLKQLSQLREKAMKMFKQDLAGTEGSEYEAMMTADEFFRREAEDSTRQNPEWDYSKETSNLKSALSEIASRARKTQEVKLAASKQTTQAMQYLQMQQQQVQAMQQQIQGASSPWNIGAAYRVPDSNINLSCTYQQGRGNIQISCVPDEAASLLGPNGFVNGVTPGNVGVSFNINI